MKITILVPANKPIRPKTVQSLLDMVVASPYEFEIILAEEGYTPSEKRNYGIVQAINKKADYILFVDDDMVFGPGTLKKLISRNKDVIGVVYYFKRPELSPIIELLDGMKNEPFECKGVGAGLLLVKTSVLMRMKRPWFDTKVNDIGMTVLGDSYFFCDRVREAGFEVWCDPTIEVHHLGDYKYGPPQLLQIQEEFDELLKYVKDKKLILEIGTALGGSLFWMMKAAPEAEFVSIDLPKGKYGGKLGQPNIEDMQSWCEPGQKLHIIRADSHAQETIEEVKKILNGRKFDFVFIDGDHSYEGVKKDYENYKELCSGLIAFHDIVESKFLIMDEMIKVKKLWDELKGEKIEIIKDRNQGNCGIGIIKC